MLLRAQLIIYLHWQCNGEYLSRFNALQQFAGGADSGDFVIKQEVIKSTSQLRNQFALTAVIRHQIYNGFGFRQDKCEFLELTKAFLLSQQQLQVVYPAEVKVEQPIQLPSHLKGLQMGADA